MLFVVRHGQTAANAAGLLLGRADPPLTAIGRRQAEALAIALPRPDRLLSSPLHRARDTAAAFGVEVVIDDRWIELDYGELDGAPVASVTTDLWQRWRADPGFVPSGGESLQDLGARVREACAELEPDARDHNVVVVTHVSPIKAAVAWALDASDSVVWRMFVEEAAVARISVGPYGPSLRSFNERYVRPAP